MELKSCRRISAILVVCAIFGEIYVFCFVFFFLWKYEIADYSRFHEKSKNQLYLWNSRNKMSFVHMNFPWFAKKVVCTTWTNYTKRMNKFKKIEKQKVVCAMWIFLVRKSYASHTSYVVWGFSALLQNDENVHSTILYGLGVCVSVCAFFSKVTTHWWQVSYVSYR